MKITKNRLKEIVREELNEMRPYTSKDLPTQTIIDTIKKNLDIA